MLINHEVVALDVSGVRQTVLVGVCTGAGHALMMAEEAPDGEQERQRHHGRSDCPITSALGERAVAVERIGSTSVRGLAAEPIIDVLVTVPDITAEEEYLDPLLSAGY